MVTSTALLIRERGAAGTSIDDVLAHSGAPRGSVYHHFPGGRAQLLAEAVDFAGEVVADLIGRPADDAIDVLRRFLDTYRDTLVATDFRAGCPVAAVAVEANADAPQGQAAAGAAFARWTELLAARLAAHGAAPARARELATFAIASIEGALILCRAERSTRPLDAVEDLLLSTLRGELDPRREPTTKLTTAPTTTERTPPCR